MMTKQLSKICLLILIAILTNSVHAQVKPYGFDKITASDFSLTNIIDSTAEAVVIADVGNTSFNYGPTGFYLIFERTTRIRILKPAGTSHATIEIPLYKTSNNNETVASFKGYTYNLENGEVVKTKVRKEDMFLEKVSEHWDQQKIAMPSVRENSIIEFSYKVNSDFTFNLQPWSFQSDIPVQISQYSVTIPEYFEYKIISHGYVPFLVNTVTRTNQKFIVHVQSAIAQQGVQSERSSARNDEYNPAATEFVWVTQNVPALKPEPYITTVKNYLASIEFELSRVKLPGSDPRDISDNWETINTKLLENDDFGRMVKKGNFISDKLPDIEANASTELEKATAIFNYVQQRVKKNEIFAIKVITSSGSLILRCSALYLRIAMRVSKSGI